MAIFMLRRTSRATPYTITPYGNSPNTKLVPRLVTTPYTPTVYTINSISLQSNGGGSAPNRTNPEGEEGDEKMKKER